MKTVLQKSKVSFKLNYEQKKFFAMHKLSMFFFITVADLSFTKAARILRNAYSRIKRI